jgi:hypothetical protein
MRRVLDIVNTKMGDFISLWISPVSAAHQEGLIGIGAAARLQRRTAIRSCSYI